MRPLRATVTAIALIALSATVALAYEPLPEQASTGLARAGEASGKVVPARPASLPSAVAELAAAVEQAAEAAEAAAHGMAVAAAAQADDTTPDTYHGADVSAVARDNHGQATAAEHVPADAGRPDGAGQPTDPGAPDGAGAPDGVGH